MKRNPIEDRMLELFHLAAGIFCEQHCEAQLPI
jgi:hypothetical protein